MQFITLNDGRTINVLHISHIEVVDTDVVYYPAKGSIDGIHESFETQQEAEDRYEELKKMLME